MDIRLKQRLIGASVLLALAVIFIPMLFRAPAPESGVSDISTIVPGEPSGEYVTRELPLIPTGAGAQGTVLPTTIAPPNTNETQTDDAAELATTATPTTPPAANTAASGEYVVSFGAYATETDAKAMMERLKQSDLTGFYEPAIINGRQAYRVRIGPYPTEAQAESARLQAVKVRSDVNARVIALNAAPAALPVPAAPATSPPVQTPPVVRPPIVVTDPTPPVRTPPAERPTTPPVTATPPTPPRTNPTPPVATPPAASDVGFAVQIGAYANATDANAMRDRLKTAGFNAFIDQVNTDKGRLNRVRVGPVAKRSDAESLKAQMAVKLGINGDVRLHP